MSKTNTFESDLLLLLFNNTNIANVGDATGLRWAARLVRGWLAVRVAAHVGSD